MTRMERGGHYTPAPSHPEWSGTVSDVGLAYEEIGQEFKDTLRIMQEHEGEIVVMPTLAGMFEGYHLPYVPALGLIANKVELMRQAGVKGWVDFDCGGIHQGLILDLVGVVQNNPSATVKERLERLAEQRYGAALVAEALSIWRIFDDAVKKLPTLLDVSDVSDFAGRFGMATGLLPWHPFLPERIIGKYAGLPIFHFDPHCFATENIAMSVPQATGDIWRAVEVDQIVKWSDPLPCSEQVGNLWEWKIAHLTKQLEQNSCALT